MQRICVFCGSSPGHDSVYLEAGQALGQLLAQRGIGVVYGGASIGLMGAVANATMQAGGEVIGIIPEAITKFEVAHDHLSELHVVETMHQRKAMMADLSDAFIALPGGIGTMEELFEVWTWGQLGYHDKPFGLLEVAGYWRKLEEFLDSMVEKGFLRQMHRDMVFYSDSAETLLTDFANYHPPSRDKWVKERGL